MRASDRAYRELRDDIVQWRLAPGTVLGEVELSERLGVSRTPVREALARLAADGLASSGSGRGLVVSGVAPGDIAALFELRHALEEQLARLAAERGDPAVFLDLAAAFRAAPGLVDRHDRAGYYELVARFDAALDEAAASPFLVAALRAVRPQLARVRRLSQDDDERLTDAAREHLAIAEAIADREADLAAAATRLHLHRSLRAILGSLERTP